MARVIGGSTIGDGCFLDPDVVIGYPAGNELPLLGGDREAEIAGATVATSARCVPERSTPAHDSAIPCAAATAG